MSKKDPTFALVGNDRGFHIYAPGNPSVFPQAYVKSSRFKFGSGFCIWAFDFGGEPTFLGSCDVEDPDKVYRETKKNAEKYIAWLSGEYACGCYMDRTDSSEGKLVEIVKTE